MDAYEKIRCARKAGRPTANDYISSIFSGFMELHGDRTFGDDHAIVGGVAWLDDMPVTVIGIEKGHSLDERVYRNFGCVLPEGYRKAQRLMKEAEKFHRPVICFVDTQGASCGQGAEKRGAGELLVTSMDEDGQKQGYDLGLTRAISEKVNIPVIASGGAGAYEHFLDAFEKGKADAVLAASLFHFGEIPIPKLKEYLRENNISVRL